MVVIFYNFDTQNNTSREEIEMTNSSVPEVSQNSDIVMQKISNPIPLVSSDDDVEYVLDTTSSDVKWEGFKIVPASSHFGSVKFLQGYLYYNEDDEISAGSFVVDMTSIGDDDLENEDNNSKLINHLGTEDFFNITEYPTAALEITNVSALVGEAGGFTHQIAANLTIKGITNNISFPATISIDDDILTAQAELEIDRTLWDVRFGSLKFGPDAIVKDVIELNVLLVANKQ